MVLTKLSPCTWAVYRLLTTTTRSTTGSIVLSLEQQIGSQQWSEHQVTQRWVWLSEGLTSLLFYTICICIRTCSWKHIYEGARTLNYVEITHAETTVDWTGNWPLLCLQISNYVILPTWRNASYLLACYIMNYEARCKSNIIVLLGCCSFFNILKKKHLLTMGLMECCTTFYWEAFHGSNRMNLPYHSYCLMLFSLTMVVTGAISWQCQICASKFNQCNKL